MPLASQLEFEAQEQRISEECGSENRSEKIICSWKDTWGSALGWKVVGIKSDKKSKKFFVNQSLMIEVPHSYAENMLGWKWSVRPADWEQFVGLHRGLIKIGCPEIGEGESIIGEDSLESEFHKLADQWYRETGMFSLIRQKAMHPCYQKIIGMGKEALPFIFREMTNGKGDWLWALEFIVRPKEDFIPKNSTFKEAVSIWLQWAKDNGYFRP